MEMNTNIKYKSKHIIIGGEYDINLKMDIQVRVLYQRFYTTNKYQSRNDF